MATHMVRNYIDQQLAEQNRQATVWRDCEEAGLRHQLLAPEELRSGTLVFRCRRCPIDIMRVSPR